MSLELVLSCVSVLMSIILTVIGLFLVNKYKNTLKFITSDAGVKGQETKQVKAIEKAVAGDILAKYPELTMLLDQLSPETAELIKKNPQLAVTLIQRYQPLIEKYLPMITGQGEKGSKTEYDL